MPVVPLYEITTSSSRASGHAVNSGKSALNPMGHITVLIIVSYEAVGVNLMGHSVVVPSTAWEILQDVQGPVPSAHSRKGKGAKRSGQQCSPSPAGFQTRAAVLVQASVTQCCQSSSSEVCCGSEWLRTATLLRSSRSPFLCRRDCRQSLASNQQEGKRL